MHYLRTASESEDGLVSRYTIAWMHTLRTAFEQVMVSRDTIESILTVDAFKATKNVKSLTAYINKKDANVSIICFVYNHINSNNIKSDAVHKVFCNSILIPS